MKARRRACFLDDDGDGRFDRQAIDDITIARKLKAPVLYSWASSR